MAIFSSISAIAPTLAAAGGEQRFEFVAAEAGPGWLSLVPLLPLLGAVICMVATLTKRDGAGGNRRPAYLVFGLLVASFALTVGGYFAWGGGAPQITHLIDWFDISWGEGPGQALVAGIGFYMDGLSWLWMLFVTGLASLICLYASEYMAGDRGYGRFFGAFALFVFSMSCLVMGDNLLLLYLGWEGVGLCSYLLIGYFYTKPAAVAAAKKAFIVNRIGDVFLAIGIYLIFVTYGTVQFDELFRLVGQGVDGAGAPVTGWQMWGIPLLLLGGAFGKSAQFPLYVWLPDAMEGPTPVSALIHAATMVTAGVYLVARMFPLFVLDDSHLGLTVVAWVGTLTALLAATIGMAQFDIKRIMAYSTVSQLGYMFAGLGVLTTTGAAYHVFTHAFFKATLFLACGAVMHGFAGQLDLRKLSGLRKIKGWGIVTIAMFVGCLNLAGVPLTAGYFSKDMILAESFYTLDSTIPGSSTIGWLLLLTAGLTAYYTFRVFFRVFVGPVDFEPGDELHGHDGEEHDGGDDHGHDDQDFHPHAPGWAINTVMAALTVGCVLAAVPYFVNSGQHGWVGGLLHDSTARYTSAEAAHGHDDAAEDDGHAAITGDQVQAEAFTLVPVRADEPKIGTSDGESNPPVVHAKTHGSILGLDPHKAMYYISAVFGLFGIGIAYLLHYRGRTRAAVSRADALLPYMGPIPRWAQNKWYVDELYEAIVRMPLWVVSHVLHVIDKVLVDGALVDGIGMLPRTIGRSIRSSQSGVLHGYATGMACGIGLILFLIWMLSL